VEEPKPEEAEQTEAQTTTPQPAANSIVIKGMPLGLNGEMALQNVSKKQKKKLLE